MTAITKVTVSIPTELLAEVQQAVAAGEFANTSEAIRDALRQWRRSRTVIALNDQELRRLVIEGRESGEPIDGEGYFASLKARYAGQNR